MPSPKDWKLFCKSCISQMQHNYYPCWRGRCSYYTRDQIRWPTDSFCPSTLQCPVKHWTPLFQANCHAFLMHGRFMILFPTEISLLEWPHMNYMQILCRCLPLRSKPWWSWFEDQHMVIRNLVKKHFNCKWLSAMCLLRWAVLQLPLT